MDLRVRQTEGRFPRFVVINLDGTYWTGDVWSYDVADARLFSSRRDAEQELDCALQRLDEGQRFQRFEAVVTVIVQSAEDIDLESLALHLHMTSDLRFEPPNDFFVEIQWGSLRRVDDE